MIQKNSNGQKIARLISTFVILFVHLGLTIKDSSYFLIFSETGYLCVGVFYFFTGYNLIYTFINNNYEVKRHYLIDKIPKIIIPTGIANIAFGLLFHGYCGRLRLLKWLLVIELANPTLWYIVSVIYIYLIYYLVFGIISKLIVRKRRTSKMLMLVIPSLLLLIIYTIVSPILFKIQGISSNLNSIIPLPLLIGMLIVIIENNSFDILKKKKLFFAIIFLIITIVLHKINNSYQISNNSIIENITSSSFALFMYFIFFNINFNNKLINSFYSVSLEIYTLHFLFILLYRNNKYIYIVDNKIYVISYIISTLMFSFILGFIKKNLCGVLNKSKKNTT